MAYSISSPSEGDLPAISATGRNEKEALKIYLIFLNASLLRDWSADDELTNTGSKGERLYYLADPMRINSIEALREFLRAGFDIDLSAKEESINFRRASIKNID